MASKKKIAHDSKELAKAAGVATIDNSVRAAAPAPATGATARTSYGLTIKSLKPVPDGVKMATQARLVAKVIADAGKNGINEQELAKALVPAGLVTRQDPLRIYRFYRKMLVKEGFIATT